MISLSCRMLPPNIDNSIAGRRRWSVHRCRRWIDGILPKSRWNEACLIRRQTRRPWQNGATYNTMTGKSTAVTCWDHRLLGSILVLLSLGFILWITTPLFFWRVGGVRFDLEPAERFSSFRMPVRRPRYNTKDRTQEVHFSGKLTANHPLLTMHKLATTVY